MLAVIRHVLGPSLRSMMAQADAARDGGRFEEAARLYAEVFKRFPDNTGVLVLSGNMLKDAGRLEAARDAYDMALVHRPDDADLHLQRGHLAKLEGRWDDALLAYRRSAALDPSHPDVTAEIRTAETNLEPLRRADPTVFTSAGGADLIALRLKSAFAFRPL